MGRSHARRCHTCRTRKLKCDGGYPACRRCTDGFVQCPGYIQKLEFVHLDQKSMQKATQSGTKAQPVTSIQIEPASCESPSSNKTGLELIARSHWVRCDDFNLKLGRILAVPQNKTWFIALLESSYVPSYPVRTTLNGTKACSSWIAKACALTTSSRKSEMLDNALLAISLTVVGDENPNCDSSKASLKHYSDALVGLRNGLQSGSVMLDEHQADIGLVTGLSCGMYEMIANRSFESLLRHLSGVGAILRDRGVDNVQSAIGRRSFYEYRSIYLPIALAMRRANFLSQLEWIDPPWKAGEPHSTTHLQTVSDVGFRLPILMEKFDHIRTSIHLSPFDSIDEYAMIVGLAHDASKIQLDLDKWEDAQLRQGDDISKFYIPRLARTIESPHIDDLGNIFPISFDYPNWDVASGLIYRDMIQIFLNNLVTQLIDYARLNNLVLPSLAFRVENSPTKQSIEAADRICQSIEYFFEDNKKLIGRMVILAPLECARAFYAQVLVAGTSIEQPDGEIGRKSKFCEKVTQRMQEGGLPNWAKHST